MKFMEVSAEENINVEEVCCMFNPITTIWTVLFPCSHFFFFTFFLRFSFCPRFCSHCFLWPLSFSWERLNLTFKVTQTLNDRCLKNDKTLTGLTGFQHYSNRTWAISEKCRLQTPIHVLGLMFRVKVSFCTCVTTSRLCSYFQKCVHEEGNRRQLE